MQGDDVASTQELVDRHLLDSHIINPEHARFETEHMAAKGVAQASNLQGDATASNNS